MLALVVIFSSVMCRFSSATLTAPIERFMDEGDKKRNPAWRTCDIKFIPDEERCPCEVIQHLSEGFGAVLSDCGYGKHHALEGPVSERRQPYPKCAPSEAFSKNISIGEGVNTVLIILWMVIDFILRRFPHTQRDPHPPREVA